MEMKIHIEEVQAEGMRVSSGKSQCKIHEKQKQCGRAPSNCTDTQDIQS